MGFRTFRRVAPMAIALALCMSTHLSAQVVEERGSDSNPAAAIFKATLYGAGTGLVLGGAYALVENNKDVSTEDALKWGVAGGAAAGLLVGLVYVATRSSPHGSVDEVGLLQLRDGDVHLAAPGMLRAGSRAIPDGRRVRTLDMNLFAVKVR